MNKNMITDDELTRLFEKDSGRVSADPGTGKRLEYLFMIKCSSYKTVQNSFEGFFSWFFSWLNVPVKVALVSVILALSFMNHQSQNNQFTSPGCDSVMNSTPFRTDTAGMLPHNTDTCFFYR